jgi:hypothetical protein
MSIKNTIRNTMYATAIAATVVACAPQREYENNVNLGTFQGPEYTTKVFRKEIGKPLDPHTTWTIYDIDAKSSDKIPQTIEIWQREGENDYEKAVIRLVGKGNDSEWCNKGVSKRNACTDKQWKTITDVVSGERARHNL